jgi:hypothetical protein
MTNDTLSPEQRRLLSVFVHKYEAARERAAHAAAVRDDAYQNLLHAAQLAIGGGENLTVDFVTWEVRTVTEQNETSPSEAL